MKKIVIFNLAGIAIITILLFSCDGNSSEQGAGDSAGRYYCFYISFYNPTCMDSGKELSAFDAAVFTGTCEDTLGGTAGKTSCVPSSNYCMEWNDTDDNIEYEMNITESICDERRTEDLYDHVEWHD